MTKSEARAILDATLFAKKKLRNVERHFRTHLGASGIDSVAWSARLNDLEEAIDMNELVLRMASEELE